MVIKGALAYHDTQTDCLGSKLNYVSICHIFMGSIIGLYQTLWLFIICSSDMMWPSSLIVRELLIGSHKNGKIWNFVEF